MEYIAEPTIAAFHASDAVVKGIRGPLGSGKSVGTAAECIRLMTLQEPNAEGIRYTRGAGVRNCYDDQTEILTEDGWRLFRDLKPGQKVAQLRDGVMEFVEPTYYYTAPYKGEMVGFRNEGVDFLVTPDHKMYVSTAHTRAKVWSPYRFEFAKDIYGKRDVRVQRDAKWVGDAGGKSVDLFEWLGFWFAEGHVGTTMGNDGSERRRLVITQVKPGGIEYARGLFKRAGIEYAECARTDLGVTFRVRTARWAGDEHNGNGLFEALKNCGKATGKAVPSWIKNAPPKHLRAFIKGFVTGDGGTWHGTTVAFTSSKALADDLQEIALRAGMVANIASRDRRGQRMVVNGVETTPTAIEYTVTFVGQAKHQPRLAVQGYRNRYPGWYKQPYDGIVYCIEVPTHIVYVRRNGRALWCSQTYPELISTTIQTWMDWYGDVTSITYGHPITARVRFPLDDGTRVDCTIYFVSADKARDVKKLKSLDLTWVWLNEASELREDVFSMAFARTWRFPHMRMGAKCTYGAVVMDTNSMDDDHWWYRMAEDKEPALTQAIEHYLRKYANVDRPLFAFFNQPPALIETVGKSGERNYRPNPDAENVRNHALGIGYWLQMIPGKRRDWVKVYVLNQYGSVASGSPVYPDYNDEIHCSKVPLAPAWDVPIRLGWDFGLFPAVTISQYMPNGQWRILDELCAKEVGFPRFIDRVVKPVLRGPKYGKFRIPEDVVSSIGDPSGTNRSAESENVQTSGSINTLRQRGLPCQPAYTNDIAARIDAVSGFLTRTVEGGQPAFLLSPTCTTLRRGFRGQYQLEKIEVTGGPDRFRDLPVKNIFSHPQDALQYQALDLDTALRSAVERRTRAHARRISGTSRPSVSVGDTSAGY